ncbi:metallophosphoesterase [Xenorhabdus sp. M]|uniref:Metallophosphoesterase n=1 Tax=Xenorhabdus szentirmaii TaxID=290112 RepID=A0AAW3YU73_9GAMM|nr:metallophosphoesterase [Xenorhabdus sp. M]MBD2801072.1 metallophosphoesterase [Xenorhabdus sp. M]
MKISIKFILNICTLFICVISQQSFSSPCLAPAPSPAPSTDYLKEFVTFINKSDKNLFLDQNKKQELSAGAWTIMPPTEIPAKTMVNFSYESIGAGSEGMYSFLHYKVEDENTPLEIFINSSKRKTIKIYTIPKNKYPTGIINCTPPGYQLARYITLTFKGNDRSDDYNIAIMSDPQPWRLNKLKWDSNAPESQKPWERVNNDVVRSINTSNSTYRFKFGIINGDITEFGRKSTWDSFYDVYNKLAFPYYIGLGNHDIFNNLNDCWEFSEISYGNNGCAAYSLMQMADKIQKYKSELFNHNINADISGKTGSYAYSWDEHNIHYVQLQYYPTYKLDIGLISPIKMTSSLEWLEQDLIKAAKNGKVSIINFHDGTDKYEENSSDEEKVKLIHLINNYNVMAVFLGHTHKVNGDRLDPPLFGKARIYNSGALFQGDFLITHVNGKCIYVTAFKGNADSIPEFYRDYPAICSSDSHATAEETLPEIEEL